MMDVAYVTKYIIHLSKKTKVRLCKSLISPWKVLYISNKTENFNFEGIGVAQKWRVARLWS